MDDPSKLANIWVSDDEFVKGLIRIDNQRIAELYADSFLKDMVSKGMVIKNWNLKQA